MVNASDAARPQCTVQTQLNTFVRFSGLFVDMNIDLAKNKDSALFTLCTCTVKNDNTVESYLI